MDYIDLPNNKDGKAYSPVGIKKLFEKAVLDEGGEIDAVFKKTNVYKTLIELWHASPLAVAVFRWLGDKYYMYPSDSPDIHFIKSINSKDQEGFSVEVMTLFKFGKDSFDGDYAKLAQGVWNTKGQKDYDRAELMLVSRLTGQIDVDKLAQEINKFDWKFMRIWLSVYTEKDSIWTLFEIRPYKDQKSIGKISVSLTDLPY